MGDIAMKKAFTMFVCLLSAAVLTNTTAWSQEKKEPERGSALTSEKLDSEGRALDERIVALGKKIEDIVVRYKLMSTKDIRVVPYQVSYRLADGYIEIQRHSYERDELTRQVTRLKKKTIRIYSSGSSVSKVESEIMERDYNGGLSTQVIIVDPTPTAAGTDDIIFTHILNGKKLLDGRKLGEVKNSTAFPVRNNLKREFLVPHLEYFSQVLLSIAETYARGIKDSDSQMYEFLKQSTSY
ncbi:MAG: hypothetical protein BWY96_00011 [Spirochaetes bacterium ADurb.BinA120]|nr:MAG: hypothetical protein BWY96_00011 [Spirochaetes bacterium ADurb.BinA120]